MSKMGIDLANLSDDVIKAEYEKRRDKILKTDQKKHDEEVEAKKRKIAREFNVYPVAVSASMIVNVVAKNENDAIASLKTSDAKYDVEDLISQSKFSYNVCKIPMKNIESKEIFVESDFLLDMDADYNICGWPSVGSFLKFKSKYSK